MHYFASKKVKNKLLKRSTLYEKQFLQILDDTCHELQPLLKFSSRRIRQQRPIRLATRQYAFPDFMLILHWPPISRILIFEIDGEYHNNAEQKHDDDIRTFLIKQKIPGSEIYRFSNDEILNKTKIKSKLSSIIESHCKKENSHDLNKFYLNYNKPIKIPHGPNKFSSKDVWLMHRKADRLMTSKEAILSHTRSKQYDIQGAAGSLKFYVEY